MSPDEALDAKAVRVALGDQRIGHHIIALDEVTSTNDVVAQLAPASQEGLVVVAERQTAGRGQYGRRWESAEGKGLWFSILLRPNLAVSESSRLTDLIAHVIASTIQENLGIAASIKPPNDVYVDTRKVAGVLVEMRVESNGGYCAITGAGINVNHQPEDFPPPLRQSAGSLATATGGRVDRTQFLIAVLRAFDRGYAEFAARVTSQV